MRENWVEIRDRSLFSITSDNRRRSVLHQETIYRCRVHTLLAIIRIIICYYIICCVLRFIQTLHSNVYNNNFKVKTISEYVASQHPANSARSRLSTVARHRDPPHGYPPARRSGFACDCGGKIITPLIHCYSRTTISRYCALKYC